ncbi:hypothetical protein RvY_13675 [Ramazzottius varieornatus]|uniref:Uncharacterized protein n=1 Tax=Ramazzottius varieornatus TaxID=947166 RepID=A0A1D1VQV9_RAMVA|nr:hypothetical protein RvY_13675 [Ramazzottius varieornatus]
MEDAPVQPQVKLIRARPQSTDDEEALPVIRDARSSGKSATTAPAPMTQLDFDAMPIPTLLKTCQPTSRVNHTLAEFDSGLFCDEMSFSSTNVDPRGRYSDAPSTARMERQSQLNRKYAKEASSYSNATSRPPSSHTDMNSSIRRGSASSKSQPSDRSAISVDQTAVPKGTRFKRQDKIPAEKVGRKTSASISASEVDPKKSLKQRTKSPADARLNMTGKNQSYTVSRESGMESLNDDTSGISSKARTRKMSRQDTMDMSEAEKKPEEIRLNLQDLMDRMQKGTRFSNDIVTAVDEFVQLTKTYPRVVESAIGVVFSQFLPLVSSLNSHVAAEAIGALEVIMPLLERRIHLVAPQIVEALSNNMQNARTSDHSKKVFTQILDMQVERAGNLLVQLSSELRRIMRKNKKEAFAFITCKYAETLGRAFPKPPKSIAAAVEVLQFVRVVLVWTTNYGDLDTSNKPEIVAVDILIQQAIRSFGADILNKVCVDYKDTIKAFLSRRESKSGEKSLGNSMRSTGTSRASKVVERKSSLMAFQKRPR